ncbi:energy-coupling factor ABC transporter substrate-binding protein [Clostridium ganghwense]|uniref:Cobalt transport protein CbiN n=1 Tax=Clostridium ganghwense TaxID=312089 RepID=A0ABT4CW75_9CLOT|nr:energy-coupling factor ABC transporter substrate-binding protein [Clostridium ganghwense]MCY6372164.1 energy-coupling factor ABC transporter substrate-binding protein [Clostridium ganghwense]
MKKSNRVLWILCVVIVVGCLIIGGKGEFGGADGQIEGTIAQLNQNYKPWFSSIWEPPSGEIESLLFALQAAIGAGFIGYYVGKKSNAKTNNSSIQDK